MLKNKNAEEKQKVLIVDDHPLVRQGIAQLINQEKDLEVCCEAGDVEQAMKKIPEYSPDIAVVDISLGQSSGIRLIEAISLKYPKLSVLTLSMHDESLYAERCLRAGAKGYIMKSEPPEKVIFALRRILDGEIYVSNKLGARLLHKLVTNDDNVYSSPVERLSNRELEVFQLIGQGLKTRTIAEQLNLSVKTIETYIDHIKKKMNFEDSRSLFLHAVQWSMGEDSK